MKIVATLAAALLLLVPARSDSSEQWMSIVTAKGGYEFKGTRTGDRWSFIVPGNTIRTMDDHGRMFAEVDSVIIQTLTVPSGDFSGTNILDSHRNFESDYLKKAGALVTGSSICSSMRLPHREWKATYAGITTIYVSALTKTHVLVLAVARPKGISVMVADTKLRSACASLRV